MVLVVLLVAGEFFARFYLGLGDPPLSMADPEIEYLFKPNQRCHRFGNLITYNQYSMRATPDFPKHKTDPTELRILMIGDSILNGGAQTDDSELASTILQRKLSDRLHRPVLVMNISAGSWGPPNQLAYVERFGLFDADVVLLVLNGEDATDVPTGEPLVGVSAAMPDRRPILALQEGVSRYLLPRITRAKKTSSDAPGDPPAASKANQAKALGALDELVRLAKGSGARVLAALHPNVSELTDGPHAGTQALEKLLQTADVPVLNLRPAFVQRNSPRELYRDFIHPNAAGQAVIAEQLLGELDRLEYLPMPNQSASSAAPPKP